MAKLQYPQNNSLLYDFMFDYGITPQDITYNVKEYAAVNIYNPKPLFVCDRKRGDMIIFYLTLQQQFAEHNEKGTPKITTRARLANPYQNSDGGTVKYLMTGKNVIYFPPQLIQAYLSKTPIDVLIVTEGEKKAFVAAKNGFDCVGISGIWNFCEKPESEDEKEQGGLLPALKDFIKVCQVKKVVLMHDSDALDIGNNKKKPATQRPSNFFKSTRRFAELIFQEGVQFFYSYINPNLDTENKLGLDDLIKKYETYDQSVLNTFYESVTANKYTTYFNTRQIQYLKDTFIKDIFHLNDPEEFYKYHKATLKTWESFRFDSRVFKINHTEDKIEEVKQSDFRSVWIADGKYRAETQNGGNKIISNFVMNVLFLLKSNTNPKRIVEFKNVLGQAFVTELSMEDLTSVSAFRKKLIGYGSFIYKGDIYELLNLSEMLFKEERVASELTSLGWQKNYGFFAFSNGITSGGKFYPVDEYGIVTYHDERFYLPAFSGLYNDADEAYENERKFKHFVESHTTFEEWSELFYKAYKNNGAIGLCFGVAVLFRDIIFGELKFFPMLNLFGQKGSGKSTVAESLLNLFGTPQSAMSLENASSTKKGMYRKFGQFRNGIVWLDEYKNSIHPDIIGLLKNLFDGIGYERAQTSQDNKTHSAPVLSSTIISGQDMPTIDPALFTRVVLLMFKNNSFAPDDKINYDLLKQMEKKGLTGITIHLLAQRELIVEHFAKEFKMWFGKLSENFKYDDIPDRLLKNVAVILAPVSILVEKQVIKLPFSLNELYAKCLDVLKQHKTLLNDNQEISVFWDVVETLFDEKVLSFENGDFRFIVDKIAVRFNRVFAAYSEKYRRMHGRNGLDKLTLTNYLKNSPSFVETKDSIRFENNVSSAFIFTYKALGINLERSVPHHPEDTTQQTEMPVILENDSVDYKTDDSNEDLPF